MTITTQTHPSLASVLWPTSGSKTVIRNIVLAIAGTLLLTLSAKVQIPFWPVPMTMQTFVVLVIGITFGPRLGAATVALYLAEGAVGLPVFAGTPAQGIGLAYMMGPTGGYLVGFLASAGLVGFLARKGWDRSVPLTLIAMVLGTVVIFLFGLSWLSSLFGFNTAIKVGLLPFLPAEAFKIALAAAVLPVGWKIVGGRS